VSSLDHRHLENLSAEILAESGFRPDIDHFAIFGLCAGCPGTSSGLIRGEDGST
jgi:hypothetical protein